MPESPPPDEKEIFCAALEIENPSERTAYLDKVCGEDPGLRARVDSLLKTHTENPDFLAEPAATDIKPASVLEGEPEPSPGQTIGYLGDYLLLSEIARGGGGVVFRARQTSLGRVVAIKMLHSGRGSLDPGAHRRFQTEVEAAATLDHPNIVPVYEVGIHAGKDYFSMKLVEGGTLNSRIKEFQEDTAKATALMIKVCRAVHHAHQQAILHRDLKPANILVDETGEPHVADFGLARYLNIDSDLTMTGAVMGTPHYMSPEQARGENRKLSVATDIYSLGAILYELIGGRKPFAGETAVALLQCVAESAPAPLRSLHPELDRDIETIIMKCLDKTPGSRYGTAGALADDLEHWTRGEPISARPPGSTERLWKWAKRKPALAAAAGLALLLAAALVISLAVSRHMLWKAWTKSEESLAFARESLDRAEGRVSYMTTVLPDLLEPAGRLDLLHGPFQNVEEYYQSIPAAGRDAEALSRHAAFVGRWSGVLWKIGKRRERLERLEQAATLVEEALRHPELSRNVWITGAFTYRNLADARYSFLDTGGAHQAAARAETLVQQGLNKFPGDLQLIREQAMLSLQKLGSLRAGGKSAEALAMAQVQAPVWRELFAGAMTGRTGSDRSLREATSNYFLEWAAAARDLSQPDEAILMEYVRLTGEASRALPDDAGARVEHGVALSHLGGSYASAGNEPRAAECFRQFLDIAREAAAMDPGSLSLALELHIAEGRYSSVARAAGDVAEEGRLLEAAAAGLERIQARDGGLDSHVNFVKAGTLRALARSLASRDRHAEACERMSQALEAQWQRALSRPSEWPEHESLENALTMTEERLEKYKGGPERILPLFTRQLAAMDAAISAPGAQPMWAWNRGGLLRLMSLRLLKSSPDADALSRAQAWMAESASLRITALDHSDAVAGMVPAAADAINTWLNAAPQPEQARIIPSARSLAAAIPAAIRLSPAGDWRSKWAEALARAAALLPPAEASPFASAAESALFGQPCGRDWSEQELKSRKLLENLTKPAGPQ